MVQVINRFLEARSAQFILATAWLLVLLVGAVDYATGRVVEVDVFYLLPIFVATWFGSRRAGIATALLAILAWVAAGGAPESGSGRWALGIWNAAVEFGFFFAVVSLFSAVKAQARQLDDLATHDPLTGIANRRRFAEAAQLEINRSARFGTPFTVAYVDLDDFKAINDARGHNAGDEALCRVAEIMRQRIRDIDTAARLGGDEFAILLAGADATSARVVVERIRSLLLESTPDQSSSLTFSVGVVTFAEPPASIEQMVEHVDAAMYAAKNSGKNRIAFASWPVARQR